MTSIKKRTTAALTAAILATTLAIPAIATEAPTIRVSSYKGSTLEVGERNGLIIGPSGTDYTVTSSDPDTVAVERVLTFWVAVAKAEGDRRDYRLQQRWRVRNRNTDSRFRSPRRSGGPRQREQRQSDGQPGDTAGDDSAHQPDPKGQRGVGVTS